MNKPVEKRFSLHYFAMLVDYLTAQGLDISTITENTGLSIEKVSQENATASLEQVCQLTDNILKQSTQVDLAIQFGAQLNLSAHGIVGYAALSSATVRQALDIANRYMPLIVPIINLTIEEEGEFAFINLQITETLPAHLERFFFEATLSSLHTMAQFMLGDKLPKLHVEMRYALENHNQEYAKRFDAEIIDNSDRNRIRLPIDLLDNNIPLANEHSFKMSVEQCEALLEALPGSKSSLRNAILKRISHNEGVLPSQEEIAKELNISTRTLHRLLQKENTTYREVLKSYTLETAKHMLKHSALSISQIAYALGYSDTANFTRAFKQNTEQSPSEFRKTPH